MNIQTEKYKIIVKNAGLFHNIVVLGKEFRKKPQCPPLGSGLAE